ncbi:MAG: tRNA uridine-5-carboxymethylaminomethyl(34) synthesis GTPase MnmE [Clostridium sp.]|nr:tRNA uridine-5-carboxymethylaminomethyl(34) synthesis GTPase MnmE [Clostridium sp.]
MNINYEFDTISAIATPLGTGGVGVIRISGEKAFETAQKIFSKEIKDAGKIYHGWIIENNSKIDEVILLPFKAPNSYTGENIIEIQCHGGPKVVKKILDLTLQNGARMAQKGEFTKRAFLNKKLDLSQAEAVLDIIHAKTSNFAQKSANNLSGALAKEISAIKKELFNLYSRMIAAIDFPEDVREPEYSLIEDETSKCIDKISNILKNANASNIMRQGIKIAIAGCPNAGKSSLFNALLNLERAIVTDIPGTTRDVIQESIDLDGIPATLIDTAGIRDNTEVDKVEAIGIEYTKNCVENADLILFLFDWSKGFDKNDAIIYEMIENKPHIKIATKADLAEVPNPEALNISSKTGFNIEELKQKIKESVIDKDSMETEFVTNQRQEECLNRAKNALTNALFATKNGELQDLISIDIKTALLSLDEITGEVITDEILENIFEHFCIGK